MELTEIKDKNAMAWRHEIEKKLKWLLLFRFAILLVIFGAVFLFFQGKEILFNLFFVYSVASLGYYGALFYWKQSQKRIGFTFIYAVMLGVELILETAIIHYSGGEASLFTLLFALTIFSAAFVFRLTGTLITAFIAVALYSVLSYLEFTQVIEPVYTATSQIVYSNDETAYAVGYIQVSLLLIIAFISGYMSQRIGAQFGELEKIRNELRRVQWNTDQILQHMVSGLITINEQGYIVYFNEAASRILQLPAEYTPGRNIEEVFPERLGEFSNLIRIALSNPIQSKKKEIYIENRYSLKIPVEIMISSLKTDEKNLGVIVLFDDITESKKKEQLLNQMEKMAAIGELSARLAHELRNPLAAIRGGVEMIQLSGNSQNPSNDKITGLIIRESDRLTNILEEFLMFARIKELPRDQFRTEKVALNRLLSECKDNIITANQGNSTLKITIKIDIPDTISVEGRKDHLMRVFNNLLQNAIEAAQNNDIKIEIRTSEKTSSVLASEDLIPIILKDNGKGIDAQKINQIFDPFYTSKVKGVGLGLSIVQSIVSQHGGFIEVKSEPGLGTEFSVFLPMV